MEGAMQEQLRRPRIFVRGQIHRLSARAMITAIDTNILLDILVPNEKFFERSGQALEDSATAGSLVICDLVYAELCIHFPAQRECDDFLESNSIRVEPLSRKAHFLASRVWRAYRQQGGQRTRILADFLIGAHAETQATCLLSRDRGFYRKLFPSLNLTDPTIG
jgi:predicted nucleic acid-binding protein